MSVDERCHLHYEIMVAGLGKSDDLTVSAHLHGLAEIGELDETATNHKRLLTGFYGSHVRSPDAHTPKHTHTHIVKHTNRNTHTEIHTHTHTF